MKLEKLREGTVALRAERNPDIQSAAAHLIRAQHSLQQAGEELQTPRYADVGKVKKLLARAIIAIDAAGDACGVELAAAVAKAFNDDAKDAGATVTIDAADPTPAPK